MVFTRRITGYDSIGGAEFHNYLQGKPSDLPLPPLEEYQEPPPPPPPLPTTSTPALRSKPLPPRPSLDELQDQTFVNRIQRWDSAAGKPKPPRSPQRPLPHSLTAIPERTLSPKSSATSSVDFIDKVRRWNANRSTASSSSGGMQTSSSSRFVERVQRFDSLTGRRVSPSRQQQQQGGYRPGLDRVREQVHPVGSRDQRFVEQVRRYNSFTGKRDGISPQPQPVIMSPVMERSAPYDFRDFASLDDQQFAAKVQRYNSMTGRPQEQPQQHQYYQQDYVHGHALAQVAEEYQRQMFHPSNSKTAFQELPNQQFIHQVQRFNSMTGKRADTPEMYQQRYEPRISIVEESPQEYFYQHPQQQFVPPDRFQHIPPPPPFQEQTFDDYHHLQDQQFTRNVTRYNSFTGSTAPLPTHTDFNRSYEPQLSFVEEEFPQTPSGYSSSDDQRHFMDMQMESPTDLQGSSFDGNFLQNVQRYNSLTGTLAPPPPPPQRYFSSMESFPEVEEDSLSSERLRNNSFYEMMEEPPLDPTRKRYATLELWKKQLADLRQMEAAGDSSHAFESIAQRSGQYADNIRRRDTFSRMKGETPTFQSSQGPGPISAVEEEVLSPRAKVSHDFRQQLLQLQRMEEVKISPSSRPTPSYHDDIGFAERIRKRDTISRLKPGVDPELERIAAQRGRFATSSISEVSPAVCTDEEASETRVQCRDLLEMIHRLRTQESISRSQVIMLKSLVISQSPQIFECIREFHSNRDETKLQSDLISVTVQNSFEDLQIS